MDSIRPCGCTYRDTGSAPLATETYDRMKTAVRVLLSAHIEDGVKWSDLCNALGAHTYESRDELHRILHLIGTPTITPVLGRGRKGTRWMLKSGN